MRIVHLVPYAMDRPGGVQSHVRDLAAWLIDQGHPTRIIAPPGAGGCDDLVWTCGTAREVTLHGTRFEFSRAGGRELAETLARLRAFGAELLHLHSPSTPMLAWQVWRRAGLPAVATFHATLPRTSRFDPVARFLFAGARYYGRRLGAVVVPSEAPRAQWVAAGLDPPLVLPPSVDLGPWRAARDAAPAERRGPRLLFVGRLEPRKGTGTLCEAWPRIRERLPEATLTVATPDAPTPALRAMAQAGGVGHVRAPSRPELQRIMAASDMLIAPSPYGESFGLVLVEAMAAGALPVAADNPGYRTVLTGPLADLLFPPGDAEALAARVARLAGDPARCATLLAAAEERAAAHDLPRIGPRYVELYARVLGRGG